MANIPGGGDIQVTVGLTGDQDVLRRLAELERQVRGQGPAAQEAAAGMKDLNRTFDQVGSTVKRVAAALGLTLTAVAALRGARRFISESIAAFQEEEEAINRLSAALRGSGQSSEQSVAGMRSFATEIQRTTTIADEQVLAMGAQIEALSGLSGQALPRATLAAIAFAKSTGVDLDAAATAVGKALEGSTTALSKWGVEIRKGATDAEVIDAVMRRFAGGLEIASAETETSGGKARQLANAWDEVKESVGGAIVTNTTMVALLEKLRSFLIDNQTEIQQVAVALAEMASVGARVFLALVQGAQSLSDKMSEGVAKLLLLADAQKALISGDFARAWDLLKQAERFDIGAAREQEETFKRMEDLFKRRLEVSKQTEEVAKSTFETYQAQRAELVAQKGIFEAFAPPAWLKEEEEAKRKAEEARKEGERLREQGDKRALDALRERIAAEKEASESVRLVQGEIIVGEKIYADALHETNDLIREGIKRAQERVAATGMITVEVEENSRAVDDLNQKFELENAQHARRIDLLREAANRAGELAQTFDSDVARGLGNALSVGLEFAANLRSIPSVADLVASGMGKVAAETLVSTQRADALANALIGVGQILANLGGLASAFGSALSGAAAGAQAFGLPGAIVGGAVGLISGALGIGDGKAEAERHANAMDKLANAAERLRDAFEDTIGPAREQAEALRKAREMVTERDVFGKFEKGTVKLDEEFNQLLHTAGLTSDEIRAFRAALNDAREAGLDPATFAVEYLTNALEPFEERLKRAAEAAGSFLEAQKFELADIEDRREQLDIMLQRPPEELTAAGITLPELPDTAAELEEFQLVIQGILDQIHQGIIEVSPETEAWLETMVLGADALGDAAREAEAPINRLREALGTASDIAELLGQSAAESVADVQRNIAEQFPGFAKLLFGEDLTADAQELQANINKIFDVFLHGTDEQIAAAKIMLMVMGLTKEEALEIAQIAKSSLETAAVASEQIAASTKGVRRGVSDRGELWKERRSGESFADLVARVQGKAAATKGAVAPVGTVTTVLAEPLLQSMDGSLRTLVATSNHYLPEIARNTGLVTIAQPGDVNRLLGQQTLQEARRL